MSLTSGLFNSGLFEGGLFNGGLFANASSSPTAWYLTVVTTGASQDYTVNINAGTGVDIYIDWGDTSSNAYTTTGQKTHNYASAGTYTVKISGEFSSNGNIRLGSNSVNRSRLKSVNPIPQLKGFTDLSYCLSNCTGLTGSIPNDLLRYVTGCTDLSYCLAYCTGLDTTVPSDLLRYVTDCTNFTGFAQGLTWTTASYSSLIISMDTYLTKTGVPFHGGNSKYDTSAAAAHTNLTSVKTWTITDGGAA